MVTGSSNNAYFSVDKRSGILRTETRLDYELHPLVLVNVRHAFDTRPNDLRHVQAIVQVWSITQMSAGKSLSSKEEQGKLVNLSGLPRFFVASEEATAKPRQGQSTLTLLLNNK